MLIHPPQVRLEVVACPLGCPPEADLVVVGRDRLGDLPGTFSVVRCRQCGLLRTDPRPTSDTIGVYYPEEYAPHQPVELVEPVPSSSTAPAGPDGDGGGPRRLRRLVRERIPTTLATALPPLSPGRMLEVGCGAGGFLQEMAAKGWDVTGIDLSPQAVALARGLGHRVHQGDVASFPPPDEPFDLVVAWMALEHLHDPVGDLARLRSWVRPDGWLALSVPDASSPEFRLFRDRWFALKLPIHLWHFTPATLTQVLARAGWRVERVRHQRTLVDPAVSASLVLRDRGRAPRWADRLARFRTRPGPARYALFPLAAALAAAGQTGRMTVWARPAPSAR
jgi:SAM-dependent methyltransferase